MAGTDARGTDLIDVIISDHRAVEAVFTELEQGAPDPEHRRRLADHVITELVRHSVAEEQHMYPAARRVLDDGDEIVDHELEEHAEAEQVMKDLEGCAATDPRFEELLSTLMSDIRHHISDEEEDLLPRLRAACSPEELAELGAKVLKAKESAPTRPHPHAPDKPPANRILDPGAGMIDRMRDALAGRSS
ncbi:hemerythrin domain-containing protein [Streptomonospora nanhaiensis]|uniref:Hemerythrin superfamily protein n=1 Tax=Streptomonospora nanhaiensis TaxID=1323731 RepID=A0A853BIP6_9ACTN|nr:hemerythrin domain-containing protein [Streptomonospora nanhaiensis]MBV2362943.1 hemerythrin domain-containing protein [Streptomonospora nanhaiensis]MBX9388948.1 hemerythrin domain-containing protein [Streptomonospora nanhaiensis]NYI95309.1 hemerythrin superfamily protein [Streptomonospora nanhaiensis]